MTVFAITTEKKTSKIDYSISNHVNVSTSPFAPSIARRLAGIRQFVLPAYGSSAAERRRRARAL